MAIASPRISISPKVKVIECHSLVVEALIIPFFHLTNYLLNESMYKLKLSMQIIIQKNTF